MCSRDGTPSSRRLRSGAALELIVGSDQRAPGSLGQQPLLVGRGLPGLLAAVFRLGHLRESAEALTAPVPHVPSPAPPDAAGGRGEPAAVAHVARGLGLTRQAVQEVADAMALEGLVVFLDNPSHKRARLMTPTPKARKALEYLRPRQLQFANLMAHGTARRLRSTLGVLRASRAAIEAAHGSSTE